jgi:putative copper export protein
MKAILFGVLIVSGVLMVLAMTKLMDGPRFSSVSEYAKAWKHFRRSRSGKVWFVSYLAFLLAFILLALNKYGLVSIGR